MLIYVPAFAQFAATFRGTTLLPSQPGFDAARKLWNAAGADLVPALIVSPTDAQGVAQAIRFARETMLPIAVRGGGHSPACFGTVHGGVVIDLGAMKGIEIDSLTRHVRMEPGLSWGEAAAALHGHGLAVTAGDVATVGVAGLTQGGGIGWFVRRYGLAIDRLRAAELVTAQGDLLRCSATEHPEVFWALRGAGANLGVITALEFEAHPAGMVYGGLLMFAASRPGEAARLLSRFAQLAHGAPEELTVQAMLMAAPPAPFVPPQLVGQTVLTVLGCYSGELSQGEEALAPFRALGQVAVDMVGPLPYPALFQMTEEAARRGFRHAIRSGFLNELTEPALAALGREVAQMLPGQIVQLRPLGGKMERPDEATAFSHRDARFLLMVEQAVPEAELDAVAWARVECLWSTVSPLSTGLYGNFAGARDEGCVSLVYRAHHLARLARVKAALDPQNVFARNVNVRPQAVRQPAGEAQAAETAVV